MCLNVLIIFCQNFAETLYASYKLEAYTNTIDKSKPVKVYQRENDYTGDCVYLAKLEEKNIKYEFATKEEFEKGCYVPVIKNIDKKLFIECGSYGKIFELNKNKAMD